MFAALTILLFCGILDRYADGGDMMIEFADKLDRLTGEIVQRLHVRVTKGYTTDVEYPI